MLLGLGLPWATGEAPRTPAQNAEYLTAVSRAALALQAAKQADAAAAAAAAKAKAKPKAKPAPAAAAPATSSPTERARSFLADVPWGTVALLGAGAVGAYVLLSGSRDQPIDNPEDDDEDDELDENPRRAMDFYRKFHWGREPKRVRSVSLSPLPRELVKLGVLEAVTYSAKKGKEKLADYIHHFGETGKKRPVLATDPRTRRLHIVGGEYDVKAAGIVD